MIQELNNKRLIQQCERVKNLISQAALTEVGQKIYGARYHNYKLMPPIPLEEVRAFEKKYNISLPDEYVYFITLVGRGGAGPGNGFIYGFPEEFKGSAERLAYPSPQLSCRMSDEQWQEKFGDSAADPYEENESDRNGGTLAVTAMDTTFLAHLIVTGKEAGKIVYLDWDGDFPPVWPKSSPNFLDWCENWFREIVLGYNVTAGTFMYYEIGTEEDLIRSFCENEDEKYRKEILYSFAKFSSLSSKTILFLEEKKHLYEQPIAYVLKKFGSYINE